ncbi:MAG: TonB-dependent receptor [Acidobacteria bacterium]|nr:TonB-dependent receptor [Acidobacteriota bacterium]
MKKPHSSILIAAVMLASAYVVVIAQSPGTPPQTPSSPACTISGTVSAGQAKLPGVAITVVPKDGGNPLLTSTGLDGSFRVHPGKPGDYDVLAELSAFASAVKTITVGPDCQAKVELTTTLRSRAPAAAATPAPAAAAATTPPVTLQQRPQAGGQQFQRVAPVAGARAGQRGQAAGVGAATGADAGGIGAAEDAQAVAQHLSLPAGFTAESVSESVTTFGSNTQMNDAFLFGGRGEGGRGGMGGEGGFGGIGGAGGEGQGGLPGMGQMGGGFAAGAFGLGGGPGGGGGGGRGGGGGEGGGGRGGAGGGGRPGFGNIRSNRPSGQASYTLGGSMLNAQPYALNGQSPAQPSFLNQRYTFAIGGPAKIPGLFDLGTRTSWFLNYSGSHGSNLYDSYSQVPSLASRTGDFSPLSTSVIDPLTGLPFPGNQIPANRISPASAALLQYIPAPNQAGATQNYHLSSTTISNGDDINFRFTRTFGTPPTGRGGRGGGGGGGGRGGGGRGAMMNNVVNLNLGVQFSRSDSSQLTGFPGIQGASHRTGWNVPVNLSFGKWGFMNTLSVQFNRSKSATTNQFGGVTNVAGAAGIVGVSPDPFDWGVPTVTFSSGLSSLRDVNPTESLNQTLAINGSMMKMKGKHTMRWGGNFQSLLSENRSNANARGSFTFTGAYTGGGTGNQTGLDFADFLLGLPQQATLQYGPGLESFHARSYSAYFQDDYRFSGAVTLSLGLRYEYQSPYTEADNRLVTLDVPSDFSAATSVQAGQTGPYTGAFPLTIVHPDRNNVAPRLGVAWRANQKTTVRGGYGINYASVPYMSMAQKLAGQPPFATTNTVIGAATTPLLMATVFAPGPPANTTTNTFGVDPNYNIGYVQIWNVDVQREINRTWSAGLTYTGTKGSSLDLLRAPNRGPSGLRIPNVQAFTWESSGSTSIMNALSMRVRKRLSMGFSGGVTYTLSKSMDDASSIGGGGAVVAQNDQNLAAEWSRSSFDQRHRVSADFAYELPFGANRKWLAGEGVLNKIVGDWILNGTLSYASGSPFTARIIGASSDISRGTNGTLRADYNGQAIDLSNPTMALFFNTAAFSVPAAGTFGNSARNLITGPTNTTFNMSMSKSMRYAGNRSMSLRIQANNVLNMPQWGSIGTVFNSLTFGRVVSMRSMRSVQIIARFSF